jgi:hypothetical protein
LGEKARYTVIRRQKSEERATGSGWGADIIIIIIIIIMSKKPITMIKWTKALNVTEYSINTSVKPFENSAGILIACYHMIE